MKIRCISNTGTSLPESYLNPALYLTKETEFQLIVGKEYTVYALYESHGEVWYYICDERYTYFPIKNPAPLFEVVDPRMSKYWQFKLWENGLLEIAFEQWFSDRYFYDKLTDQEEAEVLIFEKVKELIDAEAAETAPMLVTVEEERAIANISG